MWWWWTACRDPGRSPDDAEHTALAPHSAPEGSAETGHSGGDPCAERGGLDLAVVAEPGLLPNQLQLTVDLDAPATVAALCTSDDPDEAHLVEGTVSETHHELRFLGLLTATDYTCRVAATCPTTGGPATEVRYRTSEPPVELPTLAVTVDPELGTTGTYTLASWRDALDELAYLTVWDAEGRPRWWWRLPRGVSTGVEALVDPGTTQLVYGGGDDPEGSPTVVDLWEGEIYRSALPSWGTDRFSHDGKRIFDGRLLSLQYVPVSKGADSWLGFGVRVHDPATGVIGFTFDSQRYVDEGILPRTGENDAYHANWVAYEQTSRGPVLYVSLYRIRRILAIDGTTGDLLWELGTGLGWTVFDASGALLDESELPQGQHGCEVQEDGKLLLVYDNGVLRSQSRASAWRIDGDAHTATRVWSWTEPGWFEPILGDIDDLGNGRILLARATLGYSPHPTEYVEVDLATGRIADRRAMPTYDTMGYRAQRYGGCDLFARTAACPDLATRADELAPLLEP